MTVAAVQGSMGEIDPVSYTVPEDAGQPPEASEDAIEQARRGHRPRARDLAEDSTGIDPRTDHSSPPA